MKTRESKRRGRVKGKPLLRDRVREQLVDLIRDEELEVGDRLLSELDLAKQFKVSFPTVRAALEELVQEGIVDRRPGSGTYVKRRLRPAGSLGSGAACMVAVVLASRDHLYDEASRALIAHLHERAYMPVVLTTDRGAAGSRILPSRLRELVGMGCRRVVLVGFAGIADITDDADVRDLILTEFDQRVQMGGTLAPRAEWRMHWAAPDLPAGHRLAVDHLAALGHRRIVYLGSSTDAAYEWGLANAAYVRAYTEAMIAAGLAEHIRVLNFGVEPEDASDRLAQLRELVEAGAATALLAMMDYRCIKAREACRELHVRVPEDISLVGYYNTPWATHADLTSIDVNVDGMATAVGELVALPIGAPAQTRLVPPTLVVRHSAAKAPSPIAVAGATG